MALRVTLRSVGPRWQRAVVGAAAAIAVLLAATDASAQNASVRLRLQATAGELPPAPPVLCPLADSWGAFLVKQLDATGAAVQVATTVAAHREEEVGICFMDANPVSVPLSQNVRIVATDGALVRICEDRVFDQSSAEGHYRVIVHEAGHCSQQFVKTGG